MQARSKHSRISQTIAAVMALALGALVLARAPRQPQARDDGPPPFGTIDVLSISGGGSTTAKGLRLDITIGEPLADAALPQNPADGLQLLTGFWAVIGEGPMTPNVPGDTNGDGVVDVDDLLNVIVAWGPCPPPPANCPADVNDDGVVNVDDLLMVIINWG